MEAVQAGAGAGLGNRGRSGSRRVPRHEAVLPFASTAVPCMLHFLLDNAAPT